MLARDSGYRIRVGNSSGGTVPETDGWRERSWFQELRGQRVTRPGGRSLGQVGDSKRPLDLHGPGCVKTMSTASQGSALCLWGAKT